MDGRGFGSRVRVVRRWTAGALCAVLLVGVHVAGARADEAEDAFNFATGVLIRKDYALALEEYSAFLKKFPNHARAQEASFRRGECLYRLGRHAEAAEALAAFAQKYPQSEDRPVALWWRGDALLGQQKFEEAAGAYGALAKDYPRHELADGALYWKGECLLRAGKVDEALPVLRQAVGTGGVKYAAPALNALAWAEFTGGRYAQALVAFDELLKKHPRHEAAPGAAVKRAQCLANLKRMDEAWAAYAEIEKQYGKQFRREVLVGQARLAFDKGEFRGAAELFEAAATEFPKDEGADSALFNAGTAWYRGGDFGRAEPLFGRLAAAETGQGKPAVYWQAKSLAMLGRHAEAARLFLRAAQGAGEPEAKARACLGLGDAQSALGQSAAAAESYRKAVEAEPKGAEAETALYSAALAEAEAGRLDEAIGLCARLLRDFPQSKLGGRAELARGEFLFRKKDYASAAEVFTGLSRKPPEGVERSRLLSRRAWCALQLGNPEEASKLFGQLLEEHAKSAEAPEAAYMRGKIAQEAGRPAEAVEHFRLCRQAYPRSEHAARATVESGVSLLRQNKTEEARKTLASFLEGRPEGPLAARARLFLAEAEIGGGDAEGALRDYEALLKSAPEAELEVAALQGAGFALRAQKRFREAADRFGLCAKKYPDAVNGPAALFWEVRSLEEAGATEEAAKRYPLVAERYPQSKFAETAAYRGAAARARLAKSKAGAVQPLSEFLERHPNGEHAPEARYELAWACLEAGDRAGAAGQFERFVAGFPQHPLAADSAFRLGELKYEDKDFAGAAASYERARGMKDVAFLDKVLYKLAWARSQQGRSAEALEAFAALVAQFPKSELASEAAYRAGRILATEGKGEAAAAYFRQVSGDFADRAEFELGQMEMARGNGGAARKRFEAALAKRPNSAIRDEIRLGLGMASLSLGAHQDAEREFKAVIAGTETVTAARAQFGLGDVLFARGDYAGAGREYLKVSILYGYEEWKRKGLLRAAQSYEKAGEADRAAVYFKELAQGYADSAEGKEAARSLERLKGRKPGPAAR